MTRCVTVRKFISSVIASAVLVSGVMHSAWACTGITLSAGDGTYVRARTLEFAVDPGSEVIIVPRGYAHVGTTPDGRPGISWKTKYASVGANVLGLPVIIDGVNEKGLSIGLFYFPTSAGYMPYNPSEASKTMAPWELGTWILDNFVTVDEVRANLDGIVIPAVVLEAWKFSPPVHYIVTDASGKSIVIEYIDGKLHVYDDPLGVITNSPSFDWHMTNLRNYINFSTSNLPPLQVGSVKLEPFGQGTGMLGMPGDSTPPSRFVRAVAYSQSVLPSATGTEAVLQAFHILNTFDIPKGAARDSHKDEQGNIIADYTIWTSANDLKAKRYYFRTYNDSQIRMVDLMKMNLDAHDIAKFPMKGEETIKSLTPSV